MINFRKSLFLLSDYFQGSPIKGHLKNIQFLMEDASEKEVIKHKNKQLKKLIKHVNNTVPYYKKIDGSCNLLDFAVINKEIIRNNKDALWSVDFLNKKNHKVTTSGSSGRPFEIFQDNNKKARNTADTIYFSEKAGFKIGDKLFYFRLWDKQYKKFKFKAWVQNIVMCSVDEMTNEEISIYITALKTRKPKAILGYASALNTLCKYLEKNKTEIVDFNVKSIISMAEGLNDYTRDSLKKYFDVLPVSRYSNSENGILSQQQTNSLSKDYIINRASYYIEILNFNNDQAVIEGKSGRIVVTDLYNFCNPMIRYDTGDVGSMIYNENKELVFNKVEGRKMDMFVAADGSFISSHIIHKILQYKGIAQFQFIQENYKEFIIKLKMISGQLQPEIELELIEEYKLYFGKDSKVELQYVDEIPVLNSGKQKLVINKIIEKL